LAYRAQSIISSNCLKALPHIASEDENRKRRIRKRIREKGRRKQREERGNEVAFK
jgi:hypothetical protein